MISQALPSESESESGDEEVIEPRKVEAKKSAKKQPESGAEEPEESGETPEAGEADEEEGADDDDEEEV